MRINFHKSDLLSNNIEEGVAKIFCVAFLLSGVFFHQLPKGVFGSGTKCNGMSWFHSIIMGWFHPCVW